jgi:UDP-N-acetylmuramoyl-L-alanyl-D-glutamate--2,6-diaminopimelate ligase
MHATTELLQAAGVVRVIGTLPPAIASIATDSRLVSAGALYVALRGERVDGHDFARAAVAAGAAAVVVERELAIAAPQVVVADTRRAISRLADAFFNHPSAALRIAGVTGTNGKTTTVHLIAAILTRAGYPCATVGTLGAAFGERHSMLTNTTPLALELHAVLAELRAAGAAAVAMEVSSHALALGRVDDVRFAVAAFTNLTRDHLDFHGTFANYARAKRHLFELAPAAAINTDDPTGSTLARDFPHALSYGIDAPAQVRAQNVELEPDGSRFVVDGTVIELPLPGRFNVYNALAALAAARALGVADAVIAAALHGARSVPGRMERIGAQGIAALVDYAHTPDALENVLRAARETTRHEVIVVFGCGGDRDPGKRAQMGEIAARMADRVIVTSDNPRSEDPLDIARAIVNGNRADIILDRRCAIRRAILEAQAGDTVIVAGKGHETYQIIGAQTLPFDDRDEVRAAFAARVPAAAG